MMHRTTKKKLSSRQKLEERPRPVAYTSLFRYSSAFDKFLIVCGLLAAFVQGSAMPFMVLVLGQITDTFVEFASCNKNDDFNSTEADNYNLVSLNCSLRSNGTEEFSNSSRKLEEAMTSFAIYYVIVACVLVVTGFLQVSTLTFSSTRQIKRIRHLFFRSIMRQELEWMENSDVGKLNAKLNEDVSKIGEAIGDRMAFFTNGISAAMFGLAIGFINGWKLTLIVLAVAPVLGIATALMAKFISSWSVKEINAYADAGAIVVNVLRNIRTVVAYGAEQREVNRYNDKLGEAEKQGVRKGVLLGAFQGLIWCSLLLSYALAFWYGSTLALDPNIDFSIGRLMTVFFSVLLAAFNIGHATSTFETFFTGRCAAAGVWSVIDRESKIDPISADGESFHGVKGNVAFCNVGFSYCQRSNQKILEDFNATFALGKIYALTGASGTGKSTVLKLMQRLYDPTCGKITLDDEDISTFNVRWFRKLVGVVQQEPILFATTISQNIKLGSDRVTDDDIIEAAKAANAYDFIQKLPEKFETLVGVGGCQLSGGQKQRIAIARAMVRKPKILLLDQACSALDTQSEAMVLKNLIQNRIQRTTILVAHRASTVQIADHVIEMKCSSSCATAHTVTIVNENNGLQEQQKENFCYTNEIFTADDHADENRNKFRAEDYQNDCVVGNECNKLSNKPCSTVSSSSSCPLDGLSRRPSSTSFKSQESGGEDRVSSRGTFMRILRLNLNECHYIVLGCIGALLNGATQPLFAVLLSSVVGVYVISDDESKQEEINFYCILMSGLAAVAFIAHFLQYSMFAKSGERLTRRIRKITFSSVLRQEMAWFDKHDVESSSLPSRFANDAGQIQGAAGAQVGFSVSVITSVVLALSIALYSGWKLALLQIAFFPFVIGSHAVQSRMLHARAQRDQKKLEEAGNIVLETLPAFETVAQLGKEEYFENKYQAVLRSISWNGKKSAVTQGIVFGFATSVLYFSYAAIFRYGAELLGKGEISLENLFRVYFVIMFAGVSLGRSYRHMPGVAKAKKSASRIFQLMDRKPAIGSDKEATISPNKLRGDIQFQSCDFTYSTRKNCRVLENLNIGIESGKTLALVGRSGCGKSTIVQLIERFYDPDNGSLLIDGRNVKHYHLKFLRSKIGVVFQDPVLFEGTVYDNIAYGDFATAPTHEDVEKAAKMANIHEFISRLEQGYDTQVGNGGNRFSRGEKQRIAIARSLVRNPVILLLDEATSSLDNDNEMIVQEALDRARQGRTSIMIAHRLSTIRNADKIAVMSKGKIIESGTHKDLIENRGQYFDMVNAGATLS